jgi:Tol biopolymer transport system component
MLSIANRRSLAEASVATVLACALLTSCSGQSAPAGTRSSASPSSASVSPPSPRGPVIAFQGMAGGGDGIYLIDPSGGAPRQILTGVPGSQIHPAWSPDGTMLAFVVTTGDDGEVWVSDADGRRPHAVAKCVGACLFYDNVAWLPSGPDRLLMVRDDGPTLTGSPVPGSSVLEMVDLTTGKRRDVVTSKPRQLFSEVSVSPDGSAYCAGVEIGDTGDGITGSGIVVGRMNGGEAALVTNPKQYGAYCDWRPTGDEIVYTTHDLNVFPNMTEESDLYLMAPDGSGKRQLTHFQQGKKRATQPAWTPDGRRILVTLVEGDGSYPFRRMASLAASGGDIRWATAGGSQPGTHPTLQPSP